MLGADDIGEYIDEEDYETLHRISGIHPKPRVQEF